MDKLLKKDHSGEKIIYCCPDCNQELNYKRLLSIYGPEGLYEIADKLRALADDDVSQALNEHYDKTKV